MSRCRDPFLLLSTGENKSIEQNFDIPACFRPHTHRIAITMQFFPIRDYLYPRKKNSSNDSKFKEGNYPVKIRIPFASKWKFFPLEKGAGEFLYPRPDGAITKGWRVEPVEVSKSVVAKTRVPVSKIPCNIVTESEACPLFRWFARWWREAARGGGEASANVSDKNLSLVAAV